MNDFLKMVETIKSDEGYSDTPYQDIIGVWTIYFGNTILYTRGNQRVTQTTIGNNKSEAEKNLYCGIQSAIEKAKGYVNNFDELSSVRKCVLTMMAYQMGFNLYAFKNTKLFIESGAHVQAADEMLESKWANQTPARAKRMSSIYKLDRWL